MRCPRQGQCLSKPTGATNSGARTTPCIRDCLLAHRETILYRHGMHGHARATSLRSKLVSWPSPNLAMYMVRLGRGTNMLGQWKRGLRFTIDLRLERDNWRTRCLAHPTHAGREHRGMHIRQPTTNTRDDARGLPSLAVPGVQVAGSQCRKWHNAQT